MKIPHIFYSAITCLTFSTHGLAADTIILEPEPIEYVQVCDAYGAGYFFIPGTETCIRFSGYVRSGFEKFSIDGDIAGSLTGDTLVTDPDFQLWGNRGRLNVDTRNETEWGTLRSIFRLEAGQSNIDTDVDMDVALISIAGFRAGFAGANYWSTNHGFGAVNGEDIAANAGFVLYEQGFYGFDDATIFDYTFAQDNLAITIGAEDPRISFNTGGITNATNNGGQDGRVNFYAGLNYRNEFGTLAFTAIHDSIAFELNGVGTPADFGGWAYKVSLGLDLEEILPGGSLTGYYLYDGDYNTDYVSTYRISENPEAVYGLAFQADLNEEFQFWANYWLATGSDAVDGAGVQFTEGDTTQIGVGLNWFPEALPGFHIKAAYIYGDVENTGSSLYTSAALPRANFEFDAFTIALRRDF